MEEEKQEDGKTADETNYTIECTVSELTVKKTGIAVKIVGSEGYAIKHADKTYNIFCPEDMPAIGNCDHGYIVDSETEFTINNGFETILTQASVHGKKIRLTVSETALKNTKGKIAVDIISVSLLQK